MIKQLTAASRAYEYIRQNINYQRNKGRHDIVLDPFLSPTLSALSNWAPTYLKIKEFAQREQSQLKRKIVVYVIDTASKIDHPDLIDWVHNDKGKDFTGEGMLDNNGHGTACASCYVGKVNGVAPVGFVTIVPIKALTGSGSGSYTQVANAVKYATQVHETYFSGDRLGIISMSLGGGGSSTSLSTAISAAKRAGLWVAASSGNSGYSETVNRVKYPAKYKEVWAIGATTSAGKVATFSSAGDEVVMAGPGQNVTLAYKDGRYINGNGTSFGMPYTMAALCWIAARYPQLETMEQALNYCKRYVTDIMKPGKDVGSGFGVPILEPFLGNPPSDQPGENPTPDPDPEPPKEEPGQPEDPTTPPEGKERTLTLPLSSDKWRVDWKNSKKSTRHKLTVKSLLLEVKTKKHGTVIYDEVKDALDWFFSHNRLVLSISRDKLENSELEKLITFTDKVRLKRPYLEMFAQDMHRDYNDAAYWLNRFIPIILRNSKNLEVKIADFVAQDEKGRTTIIF